MLQPEALEPPLTKKLTDDQSGLISTTLTPQNTYALLLLIEVLHLLHHRLAKRHISFAEVTSAAVLWNLPTAPPCQVGC